MSCTQKVERVAYSSFLAQNTYRLPVVVLMTMCSPWSNCNEMSFPWDILPNSYVFRVVECHNQPYMGVLLQHGLDDHVSPKGSTMVHKKQNHLVRGFPRTVMCLEWWSAIIGHFGLIYRCAPPLCGRDDHASPKGSTMVYSEWTWSM